MLEPSRLYFCACMLMALLLVSPLHRTPRNYTKIPPQCRKVLSVLNCRRQLGIIAQFPSGGLENTGGLSGGNCKANHLENKGRPSLVASMQPSTHPPSPQLLPQYVPKSPGENVQLKGAAAENTGRRIRRRCRLTGSPPLSLLFVPVVSLLLSPSPQIWMSRLLNMRPCIFTCSFDARLPGPC